MTDKDIPKVLRLRKRHEPGAHERPTAADGARILQAQSMRYAITAGLIAIIVFSAIWTMFSLAIGEVWSPLTLLQGFLVGVAVRQAGQGVHWRFPVAAALLAFLGAIVGNIVVGAGFAATELNTGTLNVLRNVTSMTWPVFFDEVMTAADIVYALFAAGIAAFYANRRLDRREYQAVRIHLEQRSDDRD